MKITILSAIFFIWVSLAAARQGYYAYTVPQATADTLTAQPADTLSSTAANPGANESAPEVIITGHDTKGIVDSTVIRAAIDHYMQTRIDGFQQSGLPRFIITGRERRFLLGIGGFVNFRASYDFAGAVDNRDFITYDINVPGNEASRQRFAMDAASSRLFFKAIANSNTLGQVESYIEMDFRGTGNNIMRMRYAYISLKGLLFGRSVTTFCDLEAVPTTVDAEGPNAYTFNFNDMVRYSYTFPNKKWKAAISAEAPAVSTTPSSSFTPMTQRFPDIPAYVQYEWNDKFGKKHLRFSTIARDLRYYNSTLDAAHSRLGWGLQLSGLAQLPYNLSVYSQIVYGHGIARYIQDIAGVGLDLIQDPDDADKMVAPAMGGYFLAAQYSYSKTMFFCAGYSQVNLYPPHNYPEDDTYHRGKYLFANLFAKIGSSCTLGLEYIHGVRSNTDGQRGQANRLQAMIQYNF